MPEIRVQKVVKDDDSFSEIPHSRGSRSTHQDVKNVKIISEARKYVPGIDQDIFYWRKIQSHRLMPEVREQFTMAQVDQRLYIFGGLSHDCLGDFLTWDTLKWRWERMETLNDDVFIDPRLAHSCTVYGEYLLFYGGLKKFRGGFKVGDIFQGFVMYNTVTGKWNRPAKANNNMLPLRRNHVSFIIGDKFVAYGGQDENGKLYDSLMVLSLDDYEWKGLVDTTNQRVKLPVIFQRRKKNVKENKNSLKYKIEHLKVSPLIQDGSPGQVTFHAGCLVVHRVSEGTGKQFSLYDRDQHRLPHPSIIQYEGLYVFGGKDSSGEVNGNLYVLVMGKSPWNWLNLQKYIDKNGPSPSARYAHTMHYSQELDKLVLFGGRNDTFGEAKNWVLNDIWILSLNIYTWTKVKCHGDIPERRYSFGSTLSGTQLTIFGGLNGQTYNSAAVYIWELDHLKALKHVLTHGKKRAYFKEFPIKKIDDGSKIHKEPNILDLINSKKKVKLSKIETLERRLKEGKLILI